MMTQMVLHEAGDEPVGMVIAGMAAQGHRLARRPAGRLEQVRTKLFVEKRVGLARAIITKPDLIFFDEPTTGLDPITADAINDLIVEQTKALGAAAVSITHDMASARKIADEIAFLFEGKIIWRGPASTIDDSGNEYVDQFVHGRADGPIQPSL